MIDDKIKSIALYHTECYSCHSKKYEGIRRFVLDHRIGLAKFSQNRIVLKREWMMLARFYRASQGIEAPFVVITTNEDEEIVMSYNDFLERAKKVGEDILKKPAQEEPKAKPAPKKKAAKKTASIKREKVIEK